MIQKKKLDVLDEAAEAADKAGKGKKLKSGREVGIAEQLSSGALARQLRPRKQPKVFQDVTQEEADATRIVGRRIKVFWPLDVKWYAGDVKESRAKTKQHHVVYDDGDDEWLVLKDEKIKILIEPEEVFGKISISSHTFTKHFPGFNQYLDFFILEHKPLIIPVIMHNKSA